MTTLGPSERICDCCGEVGIQSYHWEEKDFDLCILCLEKLYKKVFLIEFDEPIKAYKKDRIPNNVRWKIWQRDDFTCQYCGVRDNLSIDHIFPESRGGKLTDNNLVSACKKCNSIKGNRTPEEAGMELTTDPRA